jgi:methionyl-tRNA synthetase
MRAAQYKAIKRVLKREREAKQQCDHSGTCTDHGDATTCDDCGEYLLPNSLQKAADEVPK